MVMTEAQLAEIEARANAATPGPWTADNEYDEPAVVGPDNRDLALFVETDADAAFLANARTDVPALVAEVRRLRAELAKRDEDARIAAGECRVAIPEPGTDAARLLLRSKALHEALNKEELAHLKSLAELDETRATLRVRDEQVAALRWREGE